MGNKGKVACGEGTKNSEQQAAEKLPSLESRGEEMRYGKGLSIDTSIGSFRGTKWSSGYEKWLIDVTVKERQNTNKKSGMNA